MEKKQLNFLTLENFKPKAAKYNDIYSPNNKYSFIKIELYITHEEKRLKKLTTRQKEKLFFVYYDYAKHLLLQTKYGLTIEEAQDIAKNITIDFINKHLFVFQSSLNNIFNCNQLFYKFSQQKLIQFLEIPPEKQYLICYSARIKAARNLSRNLDRRLQKEILKYRVINGMIGGNTYKELEVYASKPTVLKIWSDFINDSDSYAGGYYHHKAIFKEIINEDNNKKYEKIREKNIKNRQKEALKMKNNNNKKPLSPRELKAKRNKKLIKDFYNGLTVTELAQKYDLTKATVSEIIKNNTDTTAEAVIKKQREETLQQALLLIAAGKTQKEAAAELNISLSSLNKNLRKINYKEALTNE